MAVRRAGLVFALGLAVLALPGCEAPPSTAKQADAYRTNANKSFADGDVGIRLQHQFAREYPEPRDAYEAAYDAGKRIVGPHLRRGFVMRLPPHPSGALAKVWIAMLIGRTGKVEVVECFNAEGEPRHDATAAFVEGRVRALEFEPVTADGAAIPYSTVFPTWTDRHDWYAKASFGW